MTLKTRITSDYAVFLNSDEFAESISYTPTGESAKSIKAVVVRENVNPDTQTQGRVMQRECELYIATDSTAGVETVTKGADTASFPVHYGGSNVTWQVADVIGKDDGIWHLRMTR